MIEIIPYMLFILGMDPEHPGQIDLQRPEILFASEQECEEAGKTIAQRMTAAAANQSGTQYEFRCLRTPNADEYEQAFRGSTGRGE